MRYNSVEALDKEKMRIALVCTLVVLLACLHEGSAWFSSGGGSKSKNDSGKERSFMDRVRDFGSRAKNKVRDAGRFVSGAAKGTFEMGKAYKDMKDANWKNSDKYFHARGNHDAAKHGAGGKWAAEKISNLREIVDQRIKGDSRADSLADQAANKWGRSGKDPNKYRPKGLPDKY